MHTPTRSDNFLVPLCLASLALFFYSNILFTNRFFFPGDIFTFFYPCLSFVHEELRHFRMPLWDPYTMSGFPIIGDPEAQVFYPPNWLLVLMHPFAELPYKLVEIEEIAHLFLAGLFMYWLARSFSTTRVAALCSAVLFMFGGAMAVHTQHLASIEAMAWYPLIFLLARRGLLENNPLLTFSSGIIFGIQILAGHWQHSVYLGLFLFLYFAHEALFGPARGKLWPRWMVQLLIIAAAGAALATVQIIPTHQLGTLSVRSYLNYAEITMGNDWRFLLTLFLPNFYGGLNGVPAWNGLTFHYVFLTVPGCVLAALGLIETVRHRNFFWLGLVLLCAGISFGSHGLGKLIYHVPILNLFRNANTFFDVANFALCLMAAFGADALFSRKLPNRLLRYLPTSLASVLLAAGLAGIAFSFGARIHGWYHMLAVLALMTIAITATARGWLSFRALEISILALIIFQLFFYGMNQTFNSYPADPRTRLSRDFALGRTDVLRFLRADPTADFRFAAIAGPEWSDSGPNVWRIPGVYGWNPVTLRRYDAYMRTFTNAEEYATPWGGPDTNLNSSMLDLLGAKYVLLADSKLASGFGLARGEKFEKLFTGFDSLDVYRNTNYVSRLSFYPKAYALRDPEQVFALMTSQWFDGRKTLLKEANDVAKPASVELLPSIELAPKPAAHSTGAITADPLCATPEPMLSGWAAKGDDWLEYDLPPILNPGRYVLLMKYTAAQRPTPLLKIQVQSGSDDDPQHSDPIRLPSTSQWRCDRSRTADLGTFELAPGANHLRIASKAISDVHIYRLWLIRLPANESKDAGAFGLSNYVASANHISFQTHQERDGFVLLNEINYPGWRATVDGNPARISSGDGIFRVLWLPSGSHRVEFRFWPTHFALGAAVSLLTLGVYLGLAVPGLRRQPRSALKAIRVPLSSASGAALR